jgi:hypothetical protein
VPIEPAEEKKQQRIGFMKGQIKVPDDFDTMFQEEIIRMFEGDYVHCRTMLSVR